MKLTVLSWSSGKDAAYALYRMQSSPNYRIDSLFCTLDQESSRVSMHGVREELLDQQSISVGVPLQKLFLPSALSMEAYNELMAHEIRTFKERGIDAFAFGDILLEDLKQYREKQLQAVELQADFPLWKRDTAELAREIIDYGFKAIVTAVNSKCLDKSFVGRVFDEDFLADLPEGVDPCGENGEFHTFVYDGPNFSFPIPFEVGETVERSYASDSEDSQDTSWDTSFWFCDLLLKE